MQNTVISLRRINTLRRRAQRAAELPETPLNGWSISTVDPMRILAVFDTLRIRSGYALRAYQYCEGDNGNGVVWAMPADVEQPSPEECPTIEDAFLSPPKPPSSLDDAMDAVEGDASPFSFLCASILCRELAELGAMWHGASWIESEVVGGLPRDSGKNENSESDWTWHEDEPLEWRPQVIRVDGRTTVSFLSFNPIGMERIIRHIDTYEGDSYAAQTESHEIATGRPGIIF